MEPTKEFEKLGLFYLGKAYHMTQRQVTSELLLYKSKHLITYSVCVGMPGSGKTGLGIGLLEDPAIDAIRVIAIDPKGDLSNLLLSFPELRPDTFQEANIKPRSSQSRHDFAHDVCGRAVEHPARNPTASSRIERMPREVGVLLLASGMITGMLPPPPGPFDMSLMLAGGVALWPRGLRALEGWTQRSFPQAHRASMSFLNRFLDDLERRYPGSTV